MRRRAKVDDNQPAVVKLFRQLGWSVVHTHMVGSGFTDIVCGKNGINYLVEIKDGSKPLSARKPDSSVFLVPDVNIVTPCVNGVMTGNVCSNLFIILLQLILWEIRQHTDIFHDAKIKRKVCPN